MLNCSMWVGFSIKWKSKFMVNLDELWIVSATYFRIKSKYTMKN